MKNQLQKLFERYEADLGDYTWLYESNRWVELVFCLLNQCAKQDPKITRQAVEALQYLDLLQINNLVFLEKTTHRKHSRCSLRLEVARFFEKRRSTRCQFTCLGRVRQGDLTFVMFSQLFLLYSSDT